MNVKRSTARPKERFFLIRFRPLFFCPSAVFFAVILDTAVCRPAVLNVRQKNVYRKDHLIETDVLFPEENGSKKMRKKETEGAAGNTCGCQDGRRPGRVYVLLP